MMLRIVIYVQHLLGTGHLVRMQTLASSMFEKGHEVTLISGGVPKDSSIGPWGFIQLPAVRAGAGNFSLLLDEAGSPIDDQFKQQRKEALLEAVAEKHPDIVIVETFPFGRRQMEFELLPLLEQLEATFPKPIVVSSIRDILQTRKAKRYVQTMQRLRAYFDAVIVHGDNRVVALNASFPLAEEINGLHYSGYISYGSDQTKVLSETCSEKDVMVSAGGGAVGMKLLLASIKAKAMSPLSALRWRILIGSNSREQIIDMLDGVEFDNVIIEANRPDFSERLKYCALSISQAGYNTCLDILHAKVPSVLVPFSSEGETEQLQRAQIFQHHGLAEVLHEDELTPNALADAIKRALDMPRDLDFEVDTEGASKTVEIVENLYRERQ